MTVGIVGLGLLGGSIALDLVDRGEAVVGFDPEPATMRQATSRGITMVDRVAAVVERSELVVVATPIALVAESVRAVTEAGAVPVTDVASVRSPDALGWHTEALPTTWVGGHPLAGTERRGFGAAHRGLVVGSPWLLTPHDDIDAEALVAVADLVLRLGARPVVVDPALHDTVVATTSHLTHLLAWALHADARGLGEGVVERLAGPSFRDATRVAASSPVFWADLLERNRPAVRRALDRVQHWLDETITADQDDLLERLSAAQRVPGPPPRSDDTVEVDLDDVASALATLRAAGARGRGLVDVATVGGRRVLHVAS